MTEVSCLRKLSCLEVVDDASFLSPRLQSFYWIIPPCVHVSLCKQSICRKRVSGTETASPVLLYTVSATRGAHFVRITFPNHPDTSSSSPPRLFMMSGFSGRKGESSSLLWTSLETRYRRCVRPENMWICSVWWHCTSIMHAVMM